MYAIVLSFDRQAGLAQLVCASYAALWPGCPLVFRVPVNGAGEGPAHAFLRRRPNVELVATPADIRSTMRALLQGLDDATWVYWCIDDRYPVGVDATALEQIVREIDGGSADDLNAVRVLAWREELEPGERTLAGRRFRLMKPFGIMGLWHHQFVRARVLREIFLSERLPAAYAIDDVNRVFHDTSVPCRAMVGTAVPERVLVELAEPCVDGKLTANGFEDLVARGCEVPAYEVLTRRQCFPHGGPRA